MFGLTKPPELARHSQHIYDLQSVQEAGLREPTLLPAPRSHRQHKRRKWMCEGWMRGPGGQLNGVRPWPLLTSTAKLLTPRNSRATASLFIWGWKHIAIYIFKFADLLAWCCEKTGGIGTRIAIQYHCSTANSLRATDLKWVQNGLLTGKSLLLIRCAIKGIDFSVRYVQRSGKSIPTRSKYRHLCKK